MSKKILVVTGSSRSGGNSDLLAEAFIKGVQNAGNTVTRYDAGHKFIRPCIACDSCYRNGSPCPFDEHFNELAPMLAEADTIVFATPLYWYTFPASIKAVIDKLYAFMVGEKEISIKSAALIVCGEIADKVVFEGIIKSYELILEDRGWKDEGQLIVPGVRDKGDVLETAYIKAAEIMGRTI